MHLFLLVNKLRSIRMHNINIIIWVNKYTYMNLVSPSSGTLATSNVSRYFYDVVVKKKNHTLWNSSAFCDRELERRIYLFIIFSIWNCNNSGNNYLKRPSAPRPPLLLLSSSLPPPPPPLLPPPLLPPPLWSLAGPFWDGGEEAARGEDMNGNSNAAQMVHRLNRGSL